eukprot:TRINITY_DN5594_c0_g1_i3.p1 TRINITY_DN5594_c0_g1~~TRINITY_DN5594_c0_g1_i3.p1  ORF type:complete len:121 (-),score=23.37 TRINITY_DN5594_c0_g1_i3:107-469(-)
MKILYIAVVAATLLAVRTADAKREFLTETLASEDMDINIRTLDQQIARLRRDRLRLSALRHSQFPSVNVTPVAEQRPCPTTNWTDATVYREDTNTTFGTNVTIRPGDPNPPIGVWAKRGL